MLERTEARAIDHLRWLNTRSGQVFSTIVALFATGLWGYFINRLAAVDADDPIWKRWELYGAFADFVFIAVVSTFFTERARSLGKKNEKLMEEVNQAEVDLAIAILQEQKVRTAAGDYSRMKEAITFVATLKKSVGGSRK